MAPLHGVTCPASWSCTGTGPAWTRGDIEQPAGFRDMGTWHAAVYTPEQQQRLGVDESGNPRQVPQQHSLEVSKREVWLQAWEERLKWREAAVKEAEVEANTVFAKSRATPCLSLSCAACQRGWSERGMQVMLVDDPDSDLYQADREPENIYEVDKLHSRCRCRVRDLFCECRLNVGYHVVESCAECGMCANDLDVEFQWFFYADNTNIMPRRDPVTGETIMWPGVVVQTLSSDYADGQNDENQNVQDTPYIDRAWPSSPLADRNGRWTKAGTNKDALEQREEECRNKEAQQLDVQTRQFERERFLKDTAEEMEKQEEVLRDQFANLALREKDMDERENAVVTMERNLAERVSNQEREVAENQARAWKEAAEAQAQAQQAVNVAKEQAESRAKDAKLAVQQAQAKVFFAEAEAESLRAELAGQKQAAEAAKAHAVELEQQTRELRRIMTEEHMRQGERRRSSSRGPLPRAEEMASRNNANQYLEHISELEQQLSIARSQLVEVTAKCAALEREKANVQVQVAQLHVRLKKRDDEIDNLKSREAHSPAPGINDSLDDFEYIQTRLSRVQQISEKRAELSKWQDSLAHRERTLAKAQDELDRRNLEVNKATDTFGMGPAGAGAGSHFMMGGRRSPFAGGVSYWRAPDGSGVPPRPESRGGLVSLLFCLRRRA
mmetsp:Transcript_88002/g.152463  ORF Transcript_88002/g.152463 Transcript_88002/m.152463 type:complete len:670 (+) Transcript_88002:59-2068(+)